MLERDMVGRSLGSYRIVKKLGEGGMGAVFAAEHELLGKRVAIKVLLPEHSQNTELVHRFFNEAKAATHINHPGIIEVFDFGFDTDGGAYIVMELLRGEGLAARLEHRGPLPPLQAARLLRQLAGALEAAHGQGIIHRDLKPDNVFIVPDPDIVGGERAKILDFGIAKLADEAAKGGVKTRAGAVIGTPTYMSPEQFHGAATVDHRSDLYALGVIFFEMLTGRPPFVSEGLGELMSMHMFTPPPLASSLMPSLPPVFDELLAKLLAKSPSDRFASAHDLVVFLDHALDSIPATPALDGIATTTVPATALTPIPSVVRHHTTLSGAASQHVATMSRPGRRFSLVAAVVVVCAAAGTVIALMSRDRPEEGRQDVVDMSPPRTVKPASPPSDTNAAPDANAGSAQPVPKPPAPHAAEVPPDAALALPEPPDAAPVSPKPPREPPSAHRDFPPNAPAHPRPSAPTMPAEVIAAEAAQSHGDARGAIELARPWMHDEVARLRAYRVMVLAYCQLHNTEAARSLYGGLPTSGRGGLSPLCGRYGITLEDR